MMAEILGESIIHIDSLRHHYLAVDQTLLDEGLLDQRDDILQFWYDAIEEAGGNSAEVDYYVSAWTTDSDNVGQMPAGMPAAANTLILMTDFILMGVDIAAAWGLNGSRGYWPEDSPDTVLTFSEEDGVTPSGAVLGMLAESTVGLNFVLTDQDRRIDPDDHDDYLEFVFTSPEETVIFYSAGELDGTEMVLSIDLSPFGFFGSATIDNLGTVDGTIEGLSSVETSTQNLTDNTVTITFDQDYEVVRIVVENLAIEGGDGTDEITGTASDDYIFGNDGADVLNGWGGDDYLFGGSGTDGVYGNAGSDWLYGGTGDDRVFGGSENDFLFGDVGSDIINGQEGDDLLVGGIGSDSLFGGAGNDTLHGGPSSLETSAFDFEPEAPTFEDDWKQEALDIFGPNTLDGGAGDDTLIGSRGVDSFVFHEGHDVVQGFEIGIDQILVSVEGLSGTQVLSYDMAVTDVNEEGLLLTFGPDDTLQIIGIYEISDLL